ncbi:hypothetical protein FRZ03_18925 [Streptomyces misionensis]|uniref:Uncharacterized protein n=1 Tax=Streptomyces misionensis TaxID=67331 RepID=A0A5C6JPF8_9ACTN|nr:hypothetical protein [Streptomyces misionensis]TWV43434.1 hypothetical protein FRZ03_18925 [Streptomyces misionensis]
MDDTGFDSCPVCWSPAADGAQWILLSRHRTSEGDIEYCVSACGCVAVLLDGELLRTVPAGTPRRPMARAREERRRPAR